jgi:hypothetical protein
MIDAEITDMLMVCNPADRSSGQFFSAQYAGKAEEDSEALVWSVFTQNGRYQYRLLNGSDAPICVFRSEQRPDLKLAIELVGDWESVKLALASGACELFRN